MDFARVDLSEADRAFRERLRAFLADVVTDEVIERDRRTGENFDEAVHLALGRERYLERDYHDEAAGGFDAVRRRIWQLEVGRAHTPWFHWGTTAMVAKAVQRFGSPDLVGEVLDGVLAGRVRLCLGFTEPDGGSDVATCKTRAVRDGEGWIVNGSKTYTSNAHNAQYVFLLTNTDPTASKHRSLTMFLVPLDSPGVEIQPIRTVDGDRTNITYYTDVRVDDRYRLGEVHGGWAVLREALDAEHGTVARDTGGLEAIAVMAEHLLLLAEGLDRVAGVLGTPDAGGRRRIDDDAVAYRLGLDVARVEAAASTPGMFGRVAIAQTMRDTSSDLMNLLGAAAALPSGTPGAVDGGGVEYLFRLASPMGIYGGTLEVFRNMIAQHALGLGRPVYGGAR